MNYLIGAYLIFWLFTTGYLVTLERRQREIEKKLRQNS